MVYIAALLLHIISHKPLQTNQKKREKKLKSIHKLITKHGSNNLTNPNNTINPKFEHLGGGGESEKLPDFLDENRLEFFSKVNRFDSTFKILPSENLLLRILNVMSLSRFDKSLHST